MYLEKYSKKFCTRKLFVCSEYYSKNNDKEKHVYSAYRIAFDGKVSWSFGNDFARNVTIFRVDNSSYLIVNSSR